MCSPCLPFAPEYTYKLYWIQLQFLPPPHLHGTCYIQGGPSIREPWERTLSHGPP